MLYKYFYLGLGFNKMCYGTTRYGYQQFSQYLQGTYLLRQLSYAGPAATFTCILEYIKSQNNILYFVTKPCTVEKHKYQL